MSVKRKFSFAFKVATIVCCLIGVLSNLLRTTSIASILSFYTMQSNLFVLVFYSGYFIARKFNSDIEQTKGYHFLKGATVMVIFLTFLVYNISLQPLGFIMDVKTASSNILRFSNLFVHFLTPLMVILDYALFDEKGFFKKWYALLWLLFPAMYPLYVYTYAHFGGKFFGVGGSKKYAYFFLDLDKIGIDGVLTYLLIFCIGYVLLSLILIGFDNLLGKRKSKQQSTTCK